MKQKIKPIPTFKSHEEEFDFWLTHDTTDYFDYSTARHVDFSHLKMTTSEELKKIKHVSNDEHHFMVHDAPRKKTHFKKIK